MNYADDYKRIDFYERHSQGIKDGFHSFTVKDEHFFTFHIRSRLHLVSEAYTSKKGRDNGIASVKKNMKNKDRYKFSIPRAGKYFYFLVAGNNQSIAKSNTHGTEMSRHKAAQAVREYRGSTKSTTSRSKSKSATKSASKARAKSSSSRSSSSTSKNKVTALNGNYHKTDLRYKIFKSTNDNYYFTFRDTDENAVVMNNNVRGFKTLAEAKNGLAKVLDHGPTRSNYEIKETKNGKFYFFLKDDNKKNIGKSFFYGTRKECNDAIKLLVTSKGSGGAKKKSASKASTKSTTKSAVKKSAVASSGKKKTADTKKTAKKSSASGTNDYLPINRYDGKTGIHFFETKNGQNYFGYNGRNSTYLRSEGYSSNKARVNGIKSVIKNSKEDKRWGSEKVGSRWYYYLKAGNGQEIARSGGYESEAAMNADLSSAKRNLSGLNESSIPESTADKGTKTATGTKSGAKSGAKKASKKPASSAARKKTTTTTSKPKKSTTAKPKSSSTTSSSKPSSSTSGLKADSGNDQIKKSESSSGSSSLSASSTSESAKPKSDNLRVVPRSTDSTSSSSSESKTDKSTYSDKSSSTGSSTSSSDSSYKSAEKYSSEKSVASSDSKSELKSTSSSSSSERKISSTDEKSIIERDKGMGCSPWWLLLLLLIPILWLLLGKGCGAAEEATTAVKKETTQVVQSAADKAKASSNAAAEKAKAMQAEAAARAKQARDAAAEKARQARELAAKKVDQAKQVVKDVAPVAATPAATPAPSGPVAGQTRNSIATVIEGCIRDGNCYAPKYYKWGGTRFAQNSSSINGNAFSSLSSVASVLKRFPNARIEIYGHLSNDETDFNISQARAKSVYDYLIRKGVSSSQLNYSGQGNNSPIKTGTDAQANYQNRRVEFVLTSK